MEKVPVKFVLEEEKISVKTTETLTNIVERQVTTLERVLDMSYEAIPKQGTTISEGYWLFRGSGLMGKLIVTEVEADLFDWDTDNRIKYTIKLRKQD